ncbi:MAG: DCC1-like thiol-disulfide oxidoreductase family protein [Bacteroidota bacterium]
MLTALGKLYNKKIDARGLALFRIIYSLVLLGEVIQLFYFRHLIYDVVPNVELYEIDVTPAFIVWIISLICLVFGVFTRTSAIINYICSLFFIATIKSYEYHMFYTYMSINFLLMFLPVSRQWSLDRLFQKIKYSNTRFEYIPQKEVSSMAYFIPVFIGIALVYFDSVLYKLTDDMWLKGLGIWLPASMPMTTQAAGHAVLNQEWLMKFLSHFTIFFEFIFVFIMWTKRLRWFCVIVGIGLHIGILIEFPIPFFALGVCAIYILMMPVSIYRKLNKFKIKNPKLFFYYDAECPLCVRTKIVIQHFDILKAVSFLSIQGHAKNQPALDRIEEEKLYQDIYSVSKTGKVYNGVNTYIQVFNVIFYFKPISWLLRIPGIYHLAKFVYAKIANERETERCTEDTCGYTPPVVPQNNNEIKLLKTFSVNDLYRKIVVGFFLILIALQCLVSLNSPLIVNARKAVKLKNSVVGKHISSVSNNVNKNAKIWLGITHHSLFMKTHFDEYEHIISVSYCNKKSGLQRLPIMDEHGMPGSYLYGFNWAKWTFRTNSPKIDSVKLSSGIRSFTAFWAQKNNVSLLNDSFIVFVKKVQIPTGWQRDFLRTQLSKSTWIDAGKIYWKNKSYYSNIKNIETL